MSKEYFAKQITDKIKSALIEAEKRQISVEAIWERELEDEWQEFCEIVLEQYRQSQLEKIRYVVGDGIQSQQSTEGQIAQILREQLKPEDDILLGIPSASREIKKLFSNN